MTRAAKNNFQEGDTYEKMQFYYHPDHLGSSSYITNLDGEVVQHIEYVPFGEVFIEERNNIWNTPYLFNAKEFDEETGLYYYGARYYEPRLSLWISVDPSKEKYPDISSYTYCHNSPIVIIDPDGKDDYKMNASGYLVFWRRTNAKSTHRVFIGKASIVVGRNLVNQLVKNKGNQGSFAVTANGDDAFKFFTFAAKHTKVEWRLVGMKNGSGVKFKLSTDFNSSSVSNDMNDAKNMLFHLHSHPWNTNFGETKASGNYKEYNQVSSGKSISNYYTDGDVWTLNNIYNAYRKANPNKRFESYPRAYIYYSGDKGQKSQLYEYDLKRARFNPIFTPTYEQIKNRIYRK